jgi:hypothetical protein
MFGSFLVNVLIICSSLAYSVEHPLHVSVTEIEWDEKDKALEIMMRVFMDDLELAFRQRFNNPSLDILNPGEPSLDKMMTTYLNETFAVSLDGKKQTLNYLGHERDGEAFVFYIEVSGLKKWNRIRISNNVLMDLYDDQSHLVHVTASGKVRSLRLTKSNSSGELSF